MLLACRRIGPEFILFSFFFSPMLRLVYTLAHSYALLGFMPGVILGPYPYPCPCHLSTVTCPCPCSRGQVLYNNHFYLYSLLLLLLAAVVPSHCDAADPCLARGVSHVTRLRPISHAFLHPPHTPCDVRYLD